MNNGFFAGGGLELFRGQKQMKGQSLSEKYAADLKSVSPREKEEIHARMVAEAARRHKMVNHKPSAGTLW